MKDPALERLKALMRKAKTEDIDLAVKQTTIRIEGNIIRNKLAGQVLRRRTGNLAGSFEVKQIDNAKYRLSNKAVYAAIHEFGGTIHAKNFDHLTFNIGGQWFRKKSVEIPKRSFMGSAVEDMTLQLSGIFADYLARNMEMK